MYLKAIILSLSLVLMIKQGFSQTFSKETILISTSFGNMKLKLFKWQLLFLLIIGFIGWRWWKTQGKHEA